MPKNKTPRIVNLRDIKPGSRNISMVHLDKNQWKKTRSFLKPVKVSSMPKAGGYLEMIPDPDGGVIIYPQCDSGPDTICMIVTRHTPGGVSFECLCRPKKPTGGGGGGIVPPPPKPKCQMLHIGGRFRCVSFSNPPCRNCVLKTIEFRGRIFVFCACG